MQVREHFKRGIIEIVLLHLLSERDMYGYELLQEIEKRSDAKFLIKYSSLYPVLYRMIDRKIITDREQIVGKRRTRIYYHLTDLGKEYLDSLKSEYSYITEGFNNILNFRPEEDENA